MDASALRRLIASDEILDDQSNHIIPHGDAGSLACPVLPDDISFDDRGCSLKTHENASSTLGFIVGDDIVEDLRRPHQIDMDSPSIIDIDIL